MKRNEELTTFELLRKKLCWDPELVLPYTQEQIFQRWERAFDLRVLDNMPTKRIIEMMQEEFGVSRRTAMYDLESMETAVGFKTGMNKNLRITARINFLEDQIQKAIDREDHETAASYERSLAKYYEMIPSQASAEKRKPVVFVFNGASPDPSALMPEMPEVEDAEAILIKSVKNEQ